MVLCRPGVGFSKRRCDMDSHATPDMSSGLPRGPGLACRGAVPNLAEKGGAALPRLAKILESTSAASGVCQAAESPWRAPTAAFEAADMLRVSPRSRVEPNPLEANPGTPGDSESRKSR